MKLNFHNTLKIKKGNRELVFYNTMLASVFDKLQELSSYFNYIAVGSGLNLSPKTSPYLAEFQNIFSLKNNGGSFDPIESKLFSRKYTVINSSNLDGKYITEIGICADMADNPKIYNYFSLINDDFPNGILKEKGENIELDIEIFLELKFASSGLLTAGDNLFIKFLLGEGFNDNIVAVRGNVYADNKVMKREIPNFEKSYPCKLEFKKQESENDESLEMSFEFELGTGETKEVVLLSDGKPFARINVTDFYNPSTESKNHLPKGNYCIDMGRDVGEILEVKNATNNHVENEYYSRDYGTSFADSISLPFEEMVTSLTPRFLSADGDKIFFVINDLVYGYKYDNYSIVQIPIASGVIQNIFKVISFDKFLFVISKTAPFFSAFELNDGIFTQKQTNFAENYNDLIKLSSVRDADVSFCKNGYFILGFIDAISRNAHAMYFTFNAESDKFLYDSAYVNDNYNFDFLLAMSQNNFSDGQLMFLKGGNLSSDCRIVSLHPDKTSTDVYSVIAYYFTHETKQIGVRGRAVVVEKTTVPHIYVYYYPQVYRFSLDVFDGELDDYFSTDMLYMAQKRDNNNFVFMSLVGYDKAEEFESGLPDFVDTSKIDSIEFLGNCVILFMKDDVSPHAIGLNINNNSKVIENVSSNTDTFLVTYKKPNFLGKNNEGVRVTAKVKVIL